MASRDVQILDAVVEALKAAWIVEDRVFEMRGYSLHEDVLPALDVKLVSADTLELTVHSTALEHLVTLQVDVCVREVEGESIARTADPIMVATHRTLTTDAALAALVTELRLTAREWVDDRANGGFLRLQMTYEAEHYTARADLSLEP
jgi:hypothetical protein